MKKFSSLILLLIFVFSLSISCSVQNKKVSLKGLNTQISYHKDSINISKSELKEASIAFVKFWRCIKKNDYEEYLTHLSKKTIKNIIPDKLKKKFKKFKKYNVTISESMDVYLATFKGNPVSFESDSLLALIFILPNNQEITSSVGFDPVRVRKIRDNKSLFGLYLIKEEDEFKVSIPW